MAPLFGCRPRLNRPIATPKKAGTKATQAVTDALLRTGPGCERYQSGLRRWEEQSQRITHVTRQKRGNVTPNANPIAIRKAENDRDFIRVDVSPSEKESGYNSSEQPHLHTLQCKVLLVKCKNANARNVVFVKWEAS